MSFSKEFTMWYLTEDGWKPGKTKYDTGGCNGDSIPTEYVASFIYREEYSHGMDQNPLKEVKEREMIDKERYEELIKKYGKCPRYI